MSSTWHNLILTFLVSGNAIATASFSACATACHELAWLPSIGRVDYFNDTVYAAEQVYWSLQQSQTYPLCRYTPSCAEGVSYAIKTIRRTQCPFAVKSGGHVAFAGASNIQGGVTIDLENIHDVTVSNDQTTTSVGSGARWGNVYDLLNQRGLGVVGARNRDLGVGGFTLGGGISFLSGLYGWACDNVNNYQVVLASGNVVGANPTTNADLYHALRGGGNQFGIVTRFDLHTVPLGDMWGGLTIVPIALNKTVYEYYHDFNQNAAQDPNAHLIVALSCAPGLIPGQPCFFTNFYVYAKPVVNPPIFHNFTALPNITSTARIANISNLTAELAEEQPYGSRELWVDVTFKNDAGILEQAASMFADAVLPIYAMNLTGFAAATATQPVTSIIIANMQKNGGNALGIKPSDGPLTVLNINYQWSDKKDDAFLESSAYALLDDLTAAAKARGVYFRFEYMNYAGKKQDPYGGYGAQSKAELLAISKRYDPDRVFASLQPGYFVLS